MVMAHPGERGTGPPEVAAHARLPVLPWRLALGQAVAAGRDGIVIILAISLYVIAAWFATGAAGMAVWALKGPGRQLRPPLAAMAVMCALIAVVQILAAGDLR